MINKNDFSAVEFDDVKADLIKFFQNTGEFQDVDFTGSVANTLITAMAYNIVYMGTFVNSAVFESFIQTAKKRENVALHAQNLGYVPSGMQAASVGLDISIEQETSTTETIGSRTIVLPKGFKFYGTVDATPLSFVTTEDISISGEDGSYRGVINIYQGELFQKRVIWNNDQRIFLKNENVDRKTLNVVVDGVTFESAEDNIVYSAEDRVFYIRETIEGWTEIYFGVGRTEIVDEVEVSELVGGLSPNIGDVILIDYLLTDGPTGNNINEFTVVDSIENHIITIELLDETDDNNIVIGKQFSTGGSDRETIERIRRNSQIYSFTGRRAVTALDYESIVLKEFGSTIKTIKCWGDPTKIGYAFLAIRPNTGLNLNKSQKTEIVNFLKSRNVLTITPLIVAPKYSFVKHNVKVDYDPNLLKGNTENLKTIIEDAIDSYYDENVTTFSSAVHVSRLLRYIDDSHSSILGSEMKISLVKETTTTTATSTNGIDFQNPLIPRSFKSDSFLYTVDISTEYTINYTSTDSEKVLIGPFSSPLVGPTPYALTDFDEYDGVNDWYEVGTIDYSTGVIIFNLTAIESDLGKFEQKSLILNVDLTEQSIYSERETLLVHEPELRPQYTTISLETKFT